MSRIMTALKKFSSNNIETFLKRKISNVLKIRYFNFNAKAIPELLTLQWQDIEYSTRMESLTNHYPFQWKKDLLS